MRLGYRILVPQLVLLALLAAASGALFLDLNREQAIRSTRQHFETSTRIAERLSDLHRELSVAVLSYRLDGRVERLGSMRLADGDADTWLAAHGTLITDARERALLSAVVESRRRIRDSRNALVDAFDKGSAAGTLAAYERWQIHRRLLEANLNDFSAFNLDRFALASEQIALERVAIVRYLLYGVAAAIAVTIAAFFYVRGAMTRPLAVLTSGISAFGGGKLGARIDPRLQESRDEIGLMAKAFNGMAEDIESLNRGLEQRVAERTAQLEAANRELESFAYSVSHDLRAPLRSMDGFSLVVLEDYGGKLDAEGKDALERIRAASQRMGALIDDMLRLSQVTRAELNVVPVDLSAMARGIAAAQQQAERGRTVQWEIEEGLALRADPMLIAIALRNLIDNAWKFTGKIARPLIRVGALVNDGVKTFFVADNGAGFDMAHAGRLFGAFQRLHRVEEFPGTGVGLAIVQRIVRRHGGTIWAEAKEGEGATFFFTVGQPEG